MADDPNDELPAPKPDDPETAALACAAGPNPCAYVLLEVAACLAGCIPCADATDCIANKAAAAIETVERPRRAKGRMMLLLEKASFQDIFTAFDATTAKINANTNYRYGDSPARRTI
jgi:hypothetical protein